jgi:hypothetical protein
MPEIVSFRVDRGTLGELLALRLVRMAWLAAPAGQWQALQEPGLGPRMIHLPYGE